jgi:FkbM family methyltransferase
MIFIQNRNGTQRLYYDEWKKTGPSKKLAKKYLKQPSVLSRLHPYQFIKPSDVVLQCGAHDGLIDVGISQPIIMSVLAKKVIVIEADKNNINALKKHIEQNNISNISIIESVVWNEEGDVSFALAPEGTQGNAIAKFKSGKVIKLRASTIDRLLNRTAVNFACLTVNGAEKEAIDGAKQCFKSADIAIPLLSKGAWLFPRRARLLRNLVESGYNIAIADSNPRPWANMFYFAIATRKDADYLNRMGFRKAVGEDMKKLGL